MTTRYIPGDGSFATVMGAASGGDTIIVADGHYGSVTVTNNYASNVTVIAENALQAKFYQFQFTGASNITLDGFRVNNHPDYHLKVNGTTSNIVIQNCDIGSDPTQINWAAGIKGSAYGIHSKGTATNLTIQDNYIHHCINGAALWEYTDGLYLYRNTFDYCHQDGVICSGITNSIFGENVHGGHIGDSTHQDFFQGQSIANSGVLFRGNVMMPPSGADTTFQPIFGWWENCTARQNVFITAMINGIDMSWDCLIEENTVLCDETWSAPADQMSVIKTDEPSTTVQNNIWTIKTSGYIDGDNNALVQFAAGSGAGLYIYNEFENYVGGGTTAAGLLPASGASIGTRGAYNRILELAGELTPAAPSIPGTPTISGAEYVGQVLTANASTPVTGYPTPTRTWKWYNSVSGLVQDSTSNTYLLTSEDLGDTIYVVQAETNTEGNATAQSANTGTIAAAATAPGISIKFPADNATGVDVTIDLVLTFDTTMQAGVGSIYLWRAGAPREQWIIPSQIDTGQNHTVNITGNTVTLGTTQPMLLDADYYILIDNGALESTGGIAFPGISDPTVWNWTTGEVPASPALVMGRRMTATINVG